MILGYRTVFECLQCPGTRACLAVSLRTGHFLQEPSRGAQLARNYRGSDVDAVPQPKCTTKTYCKLKKYLFDIDRFGEIGERLFGVNGGGQKLESSYEMH